MAKSVGTVAASPLPRQHLLGRLVYAKSIHGRLLWGSVILFGVIMGLASLRVPIQSLSPEYVYRKDFLQEYTLARAVAEGVDPYQPTALLAERYLGALPSLVFPHPTPHPPPIGVLLLPLSLLDYHTAAAVWLAVEIAALGLSVYLIGRAKRARLPAYGILAIALIAVGWEPISVGMTLGQLMLPMLALLAGAWLAFHSGRRTVGGVLVGLAIAIKPVPWPLILLFAVRRDWRALAGAVSTIVATYVVAVLAVGPGRLVAYVTEVLPAVNTAYRADPWNISAASLGWRVFSGTGSQVQAGIVAPPLIEFNAVAAGVSYLIIVLIILAASFVAWRQPIFDIAYSVVICASVLASPISWEHYFALLVIPISQVFSWLADRRLPAKETSAAIGVALLLAFPQRAWTWIALVATGGEELAATSHVPVPAGLALITLMPAVAVAALACLLVWLGGRGGSTAPTTLGARQPGLVHERQ